MIESVPQFSGVTMASEKKSEAQTKMSSFSKEIIRMLSQIKEMPTMWDFKKQGVIQDKDSTFKDTEVKLYKTIQLTPFQFADQVVNLYIETMQCYYYCPELWRGGDLPRVIGEANGSPDSKFDAFVEKHDVPTNSRGLILSDLHGDFHSLGAYIRSLVSSRGYTNPDDPLKIVNSHDFWLFLGDYVDRGPWGLEVLITVMMLRILNPKQVLQARGNHEDPNMTGRFGFDTECKEKFKEESPKDLQRLFDNFNRAYNLMPVAIYMGSGNTNKVYLLGCHGRKDKGYLPNELLADESKRFEKINEFKCAEILFMIRSLVKEGNVNEEKLFVVKEGDALKPASEYFNNFKAETPTSKDNTIDFLNGEFEHNPEGLSSILRNNAHYGHKLKLSKALYERLSKLSDKVHFEISGHQHAPTDPLMMEMVEKKRCIALWEENEPAISPSDENKISLGTVIEGKVKPLTRGSVLKTTPAALSDTGRSDLHYSCACEIITGKTEEDWTYQNFSIKMAHMAQKV